MNIENCLDSFHTTLFSLPADKIDTYLQSHDIPSIIGVDEAGRGPLAGPVVACACSLPKGFFLQDLTDSKKCSPKKRQKLFEALINNPNVRYALGIVSEAQIDAMNILQATLKAMKEAITAIITDQSVVLIDGNIIPDGISNGFYLSMRPVIQGDLYVSSISAASIIAKVTRDRIVDSYDENWPHFCFKSHKGYGTKLHFEMLRKYGPLPVHRKTFEPIKSMLKCLSCS